uniref:Uncharacterized protein n=1 Tax=viral metagenome TaxID=1070528 RepID=A0A6C0BWX5_9ZZZZ
MLLTILILLSLNPTAIFSTNNTESNYFIKERSFGGSSNINTTTTNINTTTTNINDFEISGNEETPDEPIKILQNVTLIYDMTNNTIITQYSNEYSNEYENAESTLIQIFRRAIKAINEQRHFEIYPFYHLKVKSNRM